MGRLRAKGGSGPGGLPEWFTAMAAAAVSLPCFARAAVSDEGTADTLYLNPFAAADPAALSAAAFLGGLLAKCILESSGERGSRNHFTLNGLSVLALPLFRHLAGEDVGASLLAELDPAQAGALAAMVAQPGGAESLGEASHALEGYSAGGEMGTFDLLPGGEDGLVPEGNKAEYASLRSLWWLTTGVQPLLTALLDGFDQICPRDAVKALGLPGEELKLQIGGVPGRDLVADGRRHPRNG